MLTVRRVKGQSLTVEEAPAALALPADDELIWVDVVAPTGAETDLLVSALGLHSLAIEDALTPGHPPKIESFEGHTFMIVHGPELDGAGETRKVAIFVSKRWVVTIVREAHPALDRVLDRLREKPPAAPAARLVHALLDGLTDAFEGNVSELDDEVDQAEERVRAGDDRDLMTDLMAVRGKLMTLLRTVRSQRDITGSIVRAGTDAIPKSLAPYFRDVYDHLVRITEELESVRDALLAARDAHLSIANNNLSEVMRVLTVIATIMMPLSLIAGLMGMNVTVPGGGGTSHVFWVIVGGMLALAIGLVWLFRVRRWI